MSHYELSKKTTKKKLGRPPRHGGYSLLTRGELPENRRYLRPYLSGIRQRLIRDLGPGEDDLTAAQVILIDRVITYLGIVRLIEEYVRDKGIFSNAGGFLNPSLSKGYLAYNNSIRHTLQALGIDHRAVEPEMGLADIIAAHDAKADQQDEGPGPNEDQGGAGPGRNAMGGEENDRGKGIS